MKKVIMLLCTAFVMWSCASTQVQYDYVEFVLRDNQKKLTNYDIMLTVASLKEIKRLESEGWEVYETLNMQDSIPTIKLRKMKGK